MEVLSGEQMRRVDRRAIDGMGISSLDLMEAAGRGVAEALVLDYPELTTGDLPLVIVCGKGNNGGDGFVAARHLLDLGVDLRVVLLAEADELRGDAAVNLAAARSAGVEIVEAADESGWSREVDRLPSGGLVLDAILGTGVRGGARGLAARAIGDLEAGRLRVVSIDLPSGINGDARDVEGVTVRAERTYTLCRPKLPLIDGPASERAGVWSVVPIGIPDEAVRAEHPSVWWLEAGDLRGLLAPRPAEAHKGTFGHLLVLAGSKGKPGAAVLVARGALRAGVGLVTVATAASARNAVATQQAEIMTEDLAETADGAPAEAAAEAALALSRARSAVAMGPGLGTAPSTVRLVNALLRRADRPLVLDADGLNALARGRMRDLRAGERPVVMTPHPGEAARLVGADIRTVQEDRMAFARALARDTGAVVVLKGHRTVVAADDGKVAVNSTGNPGMATAGSGDVLTGIVGSFLARGIGPWDAARLAVFAHGDAGDRAAERLGQEGMIASDLLDRLPAALLDLAAPEEAG